MSRRLAVLLACVALGVTVLAGCGSGGGSDNVDVGPAAVVPQNTPLYFDATVQPTGTAEADAKAAASKIMHTSDPGGKIISQITRSSQATEKPGETFNWQQDVETWLGNQVGIFYDSLSSPDPTVVAESKDNNAALAAEREDTRDTGQTASYKGHTYDVIQGGKAFGAVGDVVVYGPVAGFQQAVDASEGDSLGDSSDFKDAIDNLPDNRLGTFYTVPKTLLAAIPAGQINPGSQAFFEKAAGDNLENPVAGALTASGDSLDLEFQGKTSGEVNTPESSLLGDVPGDAWLALGIGDVGHAARQVLDQLKNSGFPNLDQTLSQVEAATGSSVDELTGALGDAVIYVKGTSKKALSGAIVVRVSNPELVGRLLSQLQTLLSFSGGVKPLTVPGGGTGFQFNDPTQAPQPVEIAQQGDKLVVGYGTGSAREALQPSQPLSSSPSFSTAKDQVSSLGADLFLSFPPILKLVKSSGSAKDPGFHQAKPYLNALSYLVSGSGSQDGNAVLKAVLGLN